MYICICIYIHIQILIQCLLNLSDRNETVIIALTNLSTCTKPMNFWSCFLSPAGSKPPGSLLNILNTETTMSLQKLQEPRTQLFPQNYLRLGSGPDTSSPWRFQCVFPRTVSCISMRQ